MNIKSLIALENLGQRICIIGCSSSGKSTLANFLANQLSIQAHHLDQYAHLPGSNWQRLPDQVLLEKHDQLIYLSFAKVITH